MTCFSAFEGDFSIFRTPSGWTRVPIFSPRGDSHMNDVWCGSGGAVDISSELWKWGHGSNGSMPKLKEKLSLGRHGANLASSGC